MAVVQTIGHLRRLQWQDHVSHVYVLLPTNLDGDHRRKPQVVELNFVQLLALKLVPDNSKQFDNVSDVRWMPSWGASVDDGFLWDPGCSRH
jgi:hypothetical protein